MVRKKKRKFGVIPFKEKVAFRIRHHKEISERKRREAFTKRTEQRQKLIGQLQVQSEKSELRSLKRQLHRRRMERFQPLIKGVKKVRGISRPGKVKRKVGIGPNYDLPTFELGSELNRFNVERNKFTIKPRRKKRRRRRKQRSKIRKLKF